MSEPYKTADKKSPEECPYPEMHKMFRYCAYCSWKEPTCGAGHPFSGDICSQPRGHDGPHEKTIRWEK